MLDLIRPESKLSNCDIKDKLRKLNVVTHEVNISEMLQEMKELGNGMLAEGENHQEFAIDILKHLAVVQENSFLRTLEKTQDSCDRGELIMNDSII